MAATVCRSFVICVIYELKVEDGILYVVTKRARIWLRETALNAMFELAVLQYVYCLV
jgi:hypothetical protein